MLKRIMQSRAISAIFLLSAAFILSGVGWAYFTLRGIRGPLIIQFNNFAGIGQIGGLGTLLGLGVLGIIVILTNFLLALELERRDEFMGRLVTAATLLFGILIFIGYAAIISVNL